MPFGAFLTLLLSMFKKVNFYCIKYLYRILTIAYVLAGANKNIFIFKINILVHITMHVCMRMRLHRKNPFKPHFYFRREGLNIV